MKKRILLLGACLLFISGCGTKIPTLSNGEEAVISFKNGDMISVDELYNEIKDKYALQALISLMDKYILEDKYPDEIEDAKDEARLTKESVIEQFGSEDDATAAIQQYGFSTLEAYEEYVYLSILQEHAILEYAKSKITDKQVEKHYKDETVADIKVSHILIVPDVKDGMTTDEKTAADEAAKKKANELIGQLKAVKAKDLAGKFYELAKANSADTSTATDGGNMGFINKSTLSSSYKDFATEAYKLKDGEFTASIVKSDLGYHIILRVETKEKASLDSLRDTIVETLANNLINNDATTSLNALRDLRKEYGMEIVDTEIQTQYTKYIQNALQSAEEQNKSE